jgi:hypothetical protein
VKADSRSPLLSLVGAAGAPDEDGGRDETDESGLEIVYCSSLVDPSTTAGWS